jgi:hypothetical protein
MSLATSGSTATCPHVGGTDLRIVTYTAPSGSEAAAKLDFLRVSAVAALIPGR